jgi:hypothetical protein
MTSGYHRIPKDGAWRRVTLDHVGTVQTDTLWLHCGVCPHRVDEKIADFRARTGLPGDVPLMLISIALKCSRCGERKAHCWPKPYDSEDKLKAARKET